CRCIRLPPKKKMSEQRGGKHAGRAPGAGRSTGGTPGPQSGYELTPQNAMPPKDQVARIRIEKRKGNREATLVGGLEHPANDLAALLTHLKAALGCGGSVQGRSIE